MNLGDRLVILRKKRTWTQDDVAKKIGIARTTYAMYEQGRREPDANSLSKLAELFDVSIDYLITGTERSTQYVYEKIPADEREFLDWVKNNLEGTFFYDFSKSPEEQKREMMRGLRLIYEMEKGRKKE